MEQPGRLCSGTVKLRELLTRTSPVTFGLVLIHALLLAGRLASARPTQPELTPTTERPLDPGPSRAIQGLQYLTPDRALAVVRGRQPGAYLIDWSQSAAIEDAASLEGRDLLGNATARKADHVLFLDDRLVTVTGTRDYAWRFTWDEETNRVIRQRLPRRFLWLDPAGRAVTEDTVTKPDDWPPLYPPSVMTSAHLVFARPMVERRSKSNGKGDGIVRTRAGNHGIMVFDWRDGHALARFDTDGIRQVFRVPDWPGLVWTDGGSCWLEYVTCDEAGSCHLGTSMLRATEPVFAASFRPDWNRLAVCSTRHVLFYEGRVDGEVRFLGRTPISKPCRDLVLTSPRGAAAMLEDRTWVVVRMEPRP
jgi:hypothetical protein